MEGKDLYPRFRMKVHWLGKVFKCPRCSSTLASKELAENIRLGFCFRCQRTFLLEKRKKNWYARELKREEVILVENLYSNASGIWEYPYDS